jgi:hypothetical protein
MKVNIHNRCSDFDLTDGRYFSIGIDWDKEIDEQVKAGDMMSADLVPFLSAFEGVLIYDLKRKDPELARVLLFVTWKSEGYKEFRVFVQLIEDHRWRNWRKTVLEEYCQRYASQLRTYTDPINESWLVYNDDKVLMTELELNFTQRDGVLNIIISEGVKDRRAKRCKWFSPKM